MTPPIYRAAIIGCGKKAHGHARGYEGNPRTKVVAGADPDADNLKIFEDTFQVPGYSDYKEMLAKEQVDIAAPILPVKPNPEVVIGCAEAGVKAIYCEKPIASTLAEADAMVEACRSRNIPFAAGDAYRNMGEHWKVLDLIKSGELGEVASINLYQASNEISGGGCQGLSVMRMFAHDADVDWVTGWVAGDPWSDEDQNMGGVVRFANGITGFIHNKQGPQDGIEIICSKGKYFTTWGGGHVYKAEGGALKEMDGFFAEFGGTDGWMAPSGTRQRFGIQSIVDALDKGIEPLCSGDNLGKVLEIAIGLRESHRRGHAAVKFPIEDRSLTLYPHKTRLLNKKEVMGKEWYDGVIKKAAVTPLGGAKVE